MRMRPVFDLFKSAPPLDDDALTSLELQERVFADVVSDPLLTKYAVAESYRHLFVSTLLKRVEAAHGELFEPLVELVTRPPPPTLEDAFCYRVFELSTGERFVVRTMASAFSTTGLAAWSAGLRLLEWSVNRRTDLVATHVLELGCGTALAALFWQRVCRKVTLTDYAPIVLHNAQHNMMLPENGPQSAEVCYALLDFDKCSDDELGALLDDVDVVAAADILYTEQLVVMVSSLIDRILRLRPSVKVFLLQVERTRELVDAFLGRLASVNVIAVDQASVGSAEADPPLLEVAERELLRFFQFSRPPANNERAV